MSETPLLFVVTGGGTGGHVIPALAVAGELRLRGHSVVFIGTQEGMEARLVPQSGLPLELIRIGGLNRVGWRQALATCWQLPIGILRAWRLLGQLHPAAILSLGGYVAGPVIVAAWLRRLPVVALEPNAMPGMTHRLAKGMLSRVLLGVASAQAHFPAVPCEFTGIPVRPEFLTAPDVSLTPPLRILITGGSQGSGALNRAFRQSWPLFREAGLPVRFLHQCGRSAVSDLRRDFAASGLQGEVTAFIDDMPAAFAQASLVVSRSGASTVAELAAARRPSILVPFPFAADDHQRHNAEVLAGAGAARIVPDAELDGNRLFQEVAALARQPDQLRAMGAAAGQAWRGGAAGRAAEVLEETAKRVVDLEAKSRNNI
ncbi:MAG: undecaprenyldiphospho-muramoylpentapeptide beta-N-acetylglucosaminyltransferase [Acidobacteriia bacterium]|nr:undecaprenyldiphospho-muramoylpentapeptide beta-N-acetylglucosaminyltransferase [Terriglobia bacterium]